MSYAIEVTSYEITDNNGDVISDQWSPDDIGGIQETDTAIEGVCNAVREAAEDECRYGKEER